MGYLQFALCERAANRKTDSWEVSARGAILGYVRWWAAWRKYCFFPAEGTLYEQDCLREVAEFVEGQTRVYKAAGKG